MLVSLLRVSFLLPGCRSLKEKRQRLGGLRERFGRQVNVAVCESAFQDVHDRAQWSFIAVALTTRLLDQILSDIESRIVDSVDASVAEMVREPL